MVKHKKQNNILVQIVDLLNQHTNISGALIAKKLNITRTAVWKAINKLKAYNVIIATQKNGYALNQNLVLLNHDRIIKHLNKNIKLNIFETLDSTNQYLIDKNDLDTSKIHVCTTEFQSSGKGRLGKTWLSPFGQNICLSICTFLNTDLSKLGGLSLVVSLAITKTLKDISKNNDIKVKWPNDILYNKKKLSGVLVQVISEIHNLCKIVIGIGINVNHDPKLHTNEINQPWTSLKQITDKHLDRNDITPKLINNVVNYLEIFKEKGFEEFIQEWEKHDLFFNQDIILLNGNKTIKGCEVGVDKNGHLLLKQNKDITSFSCGETSFAKPF